MPCDLRCEVDQLLARYNELVAEFPLPMVLVISFQGCRMTPNSVLRTMFETDRIAPLWVELIKSVDEVWVPSNLMSKRFTARCPTGETQGRALRWIQLCLIQTGPNL